MTLYELQLPVAALFMAQATVFFYFSPRRITRFVAEKKVDAKVGAALVKKAKRTGRLIFGMGVIIAVFHFLQTKP